MPTTATDHEGFQQKICGVCTLKQENKQKITPSLLEKILRIHCDTYDLDSMPKVICKSCVVTINDMDQNGVKATKKLPAIDYSEFIVPQMTRATKEFCPCKWCSIGRMYGGPYQSYVKSVKDKIGRPKVNKQIEGTIKICLKCNSEIGKGKPHDCNKTMRNKNLGRLFKFKHIILKYKSCNLIT